MSGAASSCVFPPCFISPSVSLLPPPSRPGVRATAVCHAGLTSTASSRELYAVDSHRVEITRDIGAHGTSSRRDLRNPRKDCRPTTFTRAPPLASRQEQERERGCARRRRSGAWEWESAGARERMGSKNLATAVRDSCARDGDGCSYGATVKGGREREGWPRRIVDGQRGRHGDVAVSSVSTFLPYYWLACRGCFSLGAHRSALRRDIWIPKWWWCVFHAPGDVLLFYFIYKARETVFREIVCRQVCDFRFTCVLHMNISEKNQVSSRVFRAEVHS